ncbi:FHA domain-containing protein [Dokdonella koreensis]|uniref:DNA polymerase III subunits gamma and tau n=1 Tax=Dokdonella koreensis DS-123 TaxID=1300342 RepID=A0A167G4S2_9GAMM|nr:FHA domain-containing protein [Dokdonella koreensis]ANB16156.1 DNA polymerase III subunits gamma and tau [Dokdonella koreensis DS-123]
MVDPTTDPDALDGADLGVVDALRGLRQEAELLRARLASLKAMQGNLADAVFQRVHEDYSQRVADLEARSAPLRAQARLAYAGLRDRLAAIQHAYASIQIDRQEIDLRHQLGEYDDAERTERLAAIDSALRERSIAQDRAESLRARFLEVFESEADLEPAPPPPVSTRSATVLATLAEEPSPDEELAALTLDASMLAQIPEPGTASVVEPPPVPREDTAPAHVEAAVTQILQVLEMPDLPSIPPAPSAPVPAPPPAKAAAAPVAARAASPEPRIAVPPAAPPAPPSPASAPAAASGSTMFLRMARLVPQNAEAGRAAIPLPPKPITLGADAASDIRVGGPGVEAQHARIEANSQGYMLADLDSRHGTRVNAEPVRERLLRHEDVIQIGTARYVFREG